MLKYFQYRCEKQEKQAKIKWLNKNILITKPNVNDLNTSFQ